MAEGFVLNIPQEMLNRLQKADEKIEKLDKASRRVGENIRLAFGQGAKGVDKFIGSLNSAQKILDGFKDKKINVGLNLDAKAVTDLQKQLENLGIKIPVGVTATGGGSGSSGGNAGESQSLKNLLDKIVTLTKSVENLTHKIDGIKVTGSGSTSGGGTSNGEKTDKGIGSYKSKINELLQIEKLIHDIDKAQTELAKKGDKSLSGKSLSTISNLRQQADKLLEELTKIEEKTNKDLSSIQTKWHAKELAEEQKQSKANINIQEKEANDLIKIEEREIKEYERLMGKMLKLRKDINANTDLIYSPNPKVSQDALAQITKQEALLKQFEARAKTLEGKYGAGLSEIQLKYSQKELEMLNKAVNNPASNSGIDQKTKDLREYEKVLKRISDLEKIRDKASNAIGKYGANSQIGQQANALYQQAERLLQQHNQRRIALEQQYGTQLDSIKQAQNAKDLNYLIQQKDAELRVIEQAEKKAIQQYAKLASERNRLLTEQYNNQKIINNPKTDNATRQQAIQQQQLIAAELQRNKQAMLNIEQQYQGKLATIQQRAGQQELQRIRRQKQQEIDEIRRAEQRRQDIQRRWDERRYSRPQGALQYSQNAKTINEQIKALNYLRTAQKSLDVSTSQGKKQFYELEREIKKTENALKRYGQQISGVREQSSHLFNISQQLGRALSLMFSVSQIGQYVSKMVNVRKEMELQQRSLQVLLQSKDKANELWNQTLDLAVKSPFRVKELVTYTKQLAAYRIESDKLFETNKMLADVSAGLGVDMQRLILAFGQVKSASFLRGTELRQFTEAGIPMLEELSKYFSEIYGKSISVAEVFDMISKRMVTFTDVETVFQRMTSAGGVFFNMQEELSQTTAGMISNLQDSIDLMFNEIGKKNQGVINTAIKWARGLVDNWETVGAVMKGTLVTLLLYKAATMDINKSLAGISAKWGNISVGFSQLQSNPLDFVKTFKGNIILTALTAIATLALAAWRAIAKYRAGINEAIDAHAKFADSVNELSIDFNRLGIDKKSEDIEEYKDKLSQLVGIAQQQYNIEIDFVVNDLQSIDEVKRKFNELKEQIMSFNNFSLAFDIEFAKQERIGRGDGLGRGISKDIEKLSDEQKDLVPYFTEVNKVLASMIDNYNKLTDAEKKFVDAFRKQKETQSSGDYFNQQLEGLKLLNEEYDKFFEEEWNKKTINDDWYDVDRKARARIREKYGLEYDDVKKDLLDYENALNKVAKEQENLFTSILGNLETEIAFAREKAFGEKGSFSLDDQKNVVESYISNVINAKATAEEWAEEIKYEWQKAANKYFGKTYKGFNIIPTIEPPKDIELKKWQKAYNEEVEEILSTLESSEDKSVFLPLKIRTDLQGVATTQEKQLATINDAIDASQKELDRLEKQKANLDAKLKSGEITLLQYDALYTAQVDKQKTLIEQMTHLRDLLGGDDEKNKGRKNKIIQEQIALIKTLYNEYQKLSKEMTSDDSKRNILERFSDYAKELKIDIENIDFTNSQGVIEAYKSLESRAKAAGNEVYREFLKTFSETTVEIEMMYHIKERERIADEIQDLFSDYEMTVDLKKIDMPRNLAEDLFDVNWTELPDLKKKLDAEKSALEANNKEIDKEIEERYSKDVNDVVLESLKKQSEGNKERIEMINKFLEQWGELEKKATEERLKTYYKYLLNEQHERVKIRLETLRKLQDVEELYNKGKYTQSQKETITNKLKEEEKESLAKQTWKDFETSPMYLSLFEDIENMSKGALEQMIVTMDKLKDQLIEMGLPASVLKKILSQINKVEEELERRNPFKNFAENAKISLNRSKELARLEEQRTKQQKEYDSVKFEYDNSQERLALATDKLNSLESGTSQYRMQEVTVERLTEETNEWAEKVKTAENNLSKTNTAIVETNDASNDFYNQLKDIGTLTQSVSGGMWEIVGAIHGIPEETKETLDYLGKLEQGVMNIVGGILRIIYEDKIAGIAQLVDGLFSTVALIIDWTSGVRKANKEIERQGRILSNLTNEYERLNKELDKAWNVDNIRDYNSEMKRNLEEQIEYQKRIVATYEDMKGADKEGSVEWERVKDAEQELLNLYEQQEEMRNNMVSKLTGIAVDDVVSAAESWVDAWYEAFKETGDGLKGLEDNFNEVILNMVKRQASMKIAGKFIDEWNDALDRYVKDGYLGNSEMESYFYKVKNDLPALSSQLETFFASFDNILGDASGNLSGLQRGIQGITEQQADILASYANSCRFLLASIDTNLSQLASRVMSQMSGENPMVEQLRIIANNTQMLYNLFSGMTAPYSGGGRGLRVVI